MKITDAIVGVDYSMSCPTICILADDLTFANSQFYFLSSRKRDLSISWKNIHGIEHDGVYSSEIERFNQISIPLIGVLQELLKQGKKIKVFIEGYSMGSKGKVFNIAENTAVFKLKLHYLKIPYVEVAPTQNKKNFSGKGNANKDVMYEAFKAQGHPDIIGFYQKSGTKVGSPVGDIVDAYSLALYGHASETGTLTKREAPEAAKKKKTSLTLKPDQKA